MTALDLMGLSATFGFLALLCLLRFVFGWAIDRALCESAGGALFLFSVLYVLAWCLGL